MTKFEGYKKAFKAKKLLKTLGNAMTKLVGRKCPDTREEMTPTKTVYLNLPDEGKLADVELSNKYFSPKAVKAKDDITIDKFPVPFEYKVLIGKKEYVHCEALVVWRVYIVDSARADLSALEKKKNKKKDDDMVDLISKMMSGTQI